MKSLTSVSSLWWAIWSLGTGDVITPLFQYFRIVAFATLI